MSSEGVTVRPETPDDFDAIRRVNELAFGRPEESYLVDRLRDNGRMELSLVAVRGEQIVGHILFFPLTIELPPASFSTLGLGPMAVLPEFQNQGIGSALVRAGLEALRQGTQPGVIVLGHPEFYSRFGFVPASNFGIGTHYEVPDEVFMAIELQPNGLAGKGGTVVYSPEFDAL